MSDQVGACSGRPAGCPTPSGGWASRSSRVIAPATGAEGALRLVQRLGGGDRGHPDPGAGRRAVACGCKAGYCAVPDFAESAVDASELLLRATTAFARPQAGGRTASGSGPSSRSPLPYPT